ncbi:hypothetical protein QUB77_07830 [Microcoleus sp. AT9b-C3]
MSWPWGEWEAEDPEILAVAEKFIFANCYNPQVAGSILAQSGQCQVSETYNWRGFVVFAFLINLYENLKRLDVRVYKSRLATSLDGIALSSSPPPHASKIQGYSSTWRGLRARNRW